MTKKRIPQAPVQVAPSNKNNISVPRVNAVLITQPKPETEKNPYSELAKKYHVSIDFKPFIHLEGVSTKEFRKYRLHPADYNAVIFTSRSAVDQFFKLCDELRVKMPGETRYFCMSEAIALYLQKYILYRKRKVFYGDGTLKGIATEIVKHRTDEKYLFPCSDNHKPDIVNFLRERNYEFAEIVILKTVPAKLETQDLKYDLVVFFSPSGVQAIKQNFPGFQQAKLRMGAFGELTMKALEGEGFHLAVKAPVPEAPSMTMALEQYLAHSNK